MIVNRAELANIIGCALGTVDKYIRLGMPATRVGRTWTIDTVAAHEWIMARARAKSQKPATARELAEARIVAARASIRELEVQERLGVLVHIDDEAVVFSERQAVVRDTLSALPDLIADALAAEPDAATCRAIMRQGVHQVLDDVYHAFGGRP